MASFFPINKKHPELTNFISLRMESFVINVPITFVGLRIVYVIIPSADASMTNSSDLVFVLSYSLIGLFLLASVITLLI